MFPSYLPQNPVKFLQSLWIRDLLVELYPTVYDVGGLGVFGAPPISNAILWAPKVALREIWGKQDQTRQVSYYMKGKHEKTNELNNCAASFGLVNASTFVILGVESEILIVMSSMPPTWVVG